MMNPKLIKTNSKGNVLKERLAENGKEYIELQLYIFFSVFSKAFF